MPKRHNIRSPSLSSQESYSAVIIADLVAEVQQPVEHDLSAVQEETNFGYDDEKETNTTAVVNVEMASKKVKETNGTDISKGVILNAVQFVSSDPKLKPEIIKPISTCALSKKASDAKEKVKPLSFKEEFSHMSVVRRVAFGFSFLPSILFVLCIAVLFPCEKVLPCIDNRWSVSLNHTNVTSELNVPHNVFFTYIKDDGPGIRCIFESSGETLWEKPQLSPSKFLECGNLAKMNEKTCLIMDVNGTLQLFDSKNGKNIWDLSLDGNMNTSLPVILPDCNQDGVDEIAVAVSNSQINVIFLGFPSPVDFLGYCDTVLNIITWKRKNDSDLLIMCKKGESERLIKIPQTYWCSNEKSNKNEIKVLITTNNSVLANSKVLPTIDGLFLWIENEVTMFDETGNELWTSSSYNHTSKNRFLLYGKLRKGKPQLMLWSSDIWTHLQITVLDSKNGTAVQTNSIPNLELSKVVLVHGEEKDYVLALKKKFTESLKSKAVAQINEISSSVINILTKGKLIPLIASSTITEEITLMDLDGSDIQTVYTHILHDLKGESRTTTFTVTKNEDKKQNESLKIYVLKTPQEDLNESTILKSISLSKWDLSSVKDSRCVWKESKE